MFSKLLNRISYRNIRNFKLSSPYFTLSSFVAVGMLASSLSEYVELPKSINKFKNVESEQEDITKVLSPV